VNAVALEPHSDDVALFAAWSAIRHQAHVITVLESHVQQARGTGITQEKRWVENDCAMHHLGLSWEQWPLSDSAPDWDACRAMLEELDGDKHPEIVLAPAVEVGGHEHHNRLGDLAGDVFADRVSHYLTYTRDGGKSERGTRVAYEPEWVSRKLRALACYRTQIEVEAAGCTPHFVRGLDEYLA
jgi:LmbE family N-acetylglucosaminyl deacetylase